MRRLLSTLGFVLALGAAQTPAQAFPLGRAAPLLSPGPCANVVLRTDFAANGGAGLYCLNGVRYPNFLAIPGATFTRASSKTASTSSGLVVSFPSGVPAITDLGFLPEEARTNSLASSQAINNAAWTTTQAASANNTGLAPDGTSTASTLSEDTSVGVQHRVDQAFTYAAVPYTLSVYAKAKERSWLQLRISLTGAYFDIQNCALGTVTNGVTAMATKVANGFCRVAITFTPTAGAAAARINIATGDNGGNYNGDGVSGVYLWGAQLEAGAFATSYIPTTSSAVARAADVASISGVAMPSAYTWVARATYAAGQASGTFPSVAGSTGNNGMFVIASTSQGGANMGGGGFNNAVGPTFANGQSVRWAFRSAASDANLAVNGTPYIHATTFTPATGSSTVYVGVNGVGAAPWNGYVQSFAILPPPHSDAQLKADTQ